MKRSGRLALVGVVAAGLAAGGWWFARGGNETGQGGGVKEALVGEARTGSLTLALPAVVGDVQITSSSLPGRPIVLIDPGHGGSDPGASGVSGTVQEKMLTLAFAEELRTRLAQQGRVRVALTREGDQTLDLPSRAAIARRIGASLYLAIHMDSAPNAEARGATAYSLSEVASDAQAASLAASQNKGLAPVSSASEDRVRALLTDLAFRDQMEQSAGLAERLVRKIVGRGGEGRLRPNPHRFANFHVLRRSETPAVLFEAGYVSNREDEALLSTPEGRAPLVAALADAIEAEAALIATR